MAEDTTTEQLVERVQRGDTSAMGELMDRHRDRLRRMVSFRIDPRLSARVDPSDVVQDSLAEAVEKLPGYIELRPLPFYPWLRQIAWRRLVRLHEYHLRTAKRNIDQEINLRMQLSEHSSIELAQRLIGPATGPSAAMMRKEQTQTLRLALARLTPEQQDVLILRYIEQFTAKEIAAILEISPDAVTMRHVRALERMRELLGDRFGEPFR